MIKYVLENTPPENEVKVKLTLHSSGTITLMVGEWNVFLLHPDGTGFLSTDISKENKEGLQTDKNGSIVLRR